MIEIELGDLKRLGKEIAELLAQRLKAEVNVKGKLLVIRDDAALHKSGVKDVKTQMKHVLHQLGFSKEYRVLSEQHRIRIVKIEERARHAGREGRPPAPAETLPYLFPYRTRKIYSGSILPW